MFGLLTRHFSVESVDENSRSSLSSTRISSCLFPENRRELLLLHLEDYTKLNKNIIEWNLSTMNSPEITQSVPIKEVSSFQCRITQLKLWKALKNHPVFNCG